MIAATRLPEIRNVEFLNSSIMFIHLSNDRTFLVPFEQFDAIKALIPEQKRDFEIIDGNQLSFLSLPDFSN